MIILLLRLAKSNLKLDLNNPSSLPFEKELSVAPYKINGESTDNNSPSDQGKDLVSLRNALGDVYYVYYPRTGLSTTATNPTMKYSLALAILTTLTG